LITGHDAVTEAVEIHRRGNDVITTDKILYLLTLSMSLLLSFVLAPLLPPPFFPPPFVGAGIVDIERVCCESVVEVSNVRFGTEDGAFVGCVGCSCPPLLVCRH
jgi:hypothetical protein